MYYGTKPPNENRSAARVAVDFLDYVKENNLHVHYDYFYNAQYFGYCYHDSNHIFQNFVIPISNL